MKKGLNPDYIMPTMEETELFAQEAADVGTQAVTNDGSGTGVISQLAIPAATESTNGVRLPFYELYLPNNGVDVTQFYFHGNLGEKVKVSFFVQD